MLPVRCTRLANFVCCWRHIDPIYPSAENHEEVLWLNSQPTHKAPRDIVAMVDAFFQFISRIVEHCPNGSLDASFDCAFWSWVIPTFTFVILCGMLWMLLHHSTPTEKMKGCLEMIEASSRYRCILNDLIQHHFVFNIVSLLQQWQASFCSTFDAKSGDKSFKT